MTPAGVTLKIDVLLWSSETNRHEVLSVLTGDADSEALLSELVRRIATESEM